MASPEHANCWLVEKNADGSFHGGVQQVAIDRLPQGEVLIAVEYSSLNYKDALSATGHPGVTRTFPHVPGIDAAGEVIESRAPSFKPGDAVLVVGYDQGQNTWGGWSSHVRVPAEWIVRLPGSLSPRQAMIFGTAGQTAAQCIAALEHHGCRPESGEVVVTGASGGVGSLAVAMLARLGYRVAAVSGKPEAQRLLQQLGATRILTREDVNDTSSRPLLKSAWAGAIDTVGGNTLATLLRSMQHGGCVAACGLVGGAELPLTVYPFILRGATLVGIDSVDVPIAERQEMWNQLAGPWRPQQLEDLAQEITLDELPAQIEKILAGNVTGRVIVRTGG